MIYNNDYAFPNANRSGQAGMTLLDWYAGQVLLHFIQEGLDYSVASRQAYEIASVMMKERKQWVS